MIYEITMRNIRVEFDFVLSILLIIMLNKYRERVHNMLPDSEQVNFYYRKVWRILNLIKATQLFLQSDEYTFYTTCFNFVCILVMTRTFYLSLKIKKALDIVKSIRN